MEIAENLRSVRFDWAINEESITIYFYFDGVITDDNRDSASCVGGEVTGDFDENVLIREECIRLDFPEKIPDHMDIVYFRKE